MPDFRTEIRGAFQRRLDAAPMAPDLRRRAANRAQRHRPLLLAEAAAIAIALLSPVVLTSMAGHLPQVARPVTAPRLSSSPTPSAAPAAAGAPKFTSYALPAGTMVADIVVGPDGAVWFTDDHGDRIGRMDAAGQVTFPARLAQWSMPSYITVGPDGAIWFTESSADKIGRLTPGGQLREYTVSTGGSVPRGITAGPDRAIWFTEQAGNKIGRLGMDGHISDFPLPNRGGAQCGNVCPEGIATGPDGALWFTESQLSIAGGNRIGRMTSTGRLSEYEIPTENSQPSRIGAGGEDGLWFTEGRAPKLGRITPDGRIYEAALPGATSEVVAGGVCPGPDHGIVFTVVKAFPGATAGGTAIGVASPTGLRQYPVPGETALLGPVTGGPDGAVWALGQTRIWKISF